MPLASASNTSMNVLPIILRFFSGSSTPARRERKASEASTYFKFRPILENVSWTRLPSPFLRTPLLTNMHVNWSPTALCTSAATTEESTPPESAHITCLPPTRSRMLRTEYSINERIVQDGVQPHMSYRKFFS